jgi:hypothetical protein
MSAHGNRAGILERRSQGPTVNYVNRGLSTGNTRRGSSGYYFVTATRVRGRGNLLVDIRKYIAEAFTMSTGSGPIAARGSRLGSTRSGCLSRGCGLLASLGLLHHLGL